MRLGSHAGGSNQAAENLLDSDLGNTQTRGEEHEPETDDFHVESRLQQAKPNGSETDFGADSINEYVLLQQ